MSRTSSHYLSCGYLPPRDFQFHRAGQTVIQPHPTMTRNQRFEPHVGRHPQANAIRQQERAMREAYRKEKKIESYLADDENYPSFANQLRQLGLQLRDIPADGNCLFRALGDQLEGHCRNHFRHRQDVVKFMMDHRKDFEPFVEDDVPFDDHINQLKKLGTHAGNDAIVSFAKLHNVNVMIHQLNGKPLLIQGPSNSANVRQLHIAYHNGDHYSSIRRDGDNTESPANIKLQDGSKAASPVSGPPGYSGGSSGIVTAQRGIEHLEAEVMRATGCQDADQVRDTLEDCDYDVDATIATLLQVLDLGDAVDDTTSLASQQTADSGIWAANGTGHRIFGGDGVSSSGTVNGKGQKVHFREDSYGGSSGYSSLNSNRGGGARPKLAIPAGHVQHHVLTGTKLKQMKKLEKKRRATERNQQRVMSMQPAPSHLHPQGHPHPHPHLKPEDATVIRHDVTRI